jgi:hypothetical protein
MYIADSYSSENDSFNGSNLCLRCKLKWGDYYFYNYRSFDGSDESATARLGKWSTEEKTFLLYFNASDTSHLNNKDFSITVNEIKSWVLKFNNNFDLFLWSSDYLLSFELERNERNLLELIVSYYKKAILLYNSQTSRDISINDINLFIIKAYILYNKYELAMEYMEETKVYDKSSLAGCKYKLKNYKDASNIISNIYISAISDIMSSAHIQIRILLKQKQELEAYELTNWTLNFIDSIIKKEGLFTDIKIIYMYLKAVCERKLKIDYFDTIKQLKAMVKNTSNDLENTENIKFYYGDNASFYTDVKDYKQKIKEEILEDKDENFELFNEVFKEVFGGDIDE